MLHVMPLTLINSFPPTLYFSSWVSDVVVTFSENYFFLSGDVRNKELFTLTTSNTN